MLPISSPETNFLARSLSKYRPRSTIGRIGGLLTEPHLHANTLRLEMLAHLAVANCEGDKRIDNNELNKWLNSYLGPLLADYEDPTEDVFITNLQTPEGNKRIFEGIWEYNDYNLQVLLDTILDCDHFQEWKHILDPAFALLSISELVADRLNLSRWYIDISHPKVSLHVNTYENRAWAISFTDAHLKSLNIDRKRISEFIFRDEDRTNIFKESVGNSSLERRPLIDFGDVLLLALPNAISPAIRRYILSELRKMGQLHIFSNYLSQYQANQVENNGLRELKKSAISLNPPKPDDNLTPSLHSLLLRYDVNKYINIVILHDRLDLVEKRGLSSFLQYPEKIGLALENYLYKVARHCQEMPDFGEGMTLVIIGGLGRGFILGLKNWPNNWRFSSISLPDLNMLSREPNSPIKLYLKFIKQKELMEAQGVTFLNPNGDFNLYCFWKQQKFQLIPRDMNIKHGTIISIGNDFVLSIRKELRILTDKHVVKTTSGHYARVMRFGYDSYFKSLQSRPIYASVSHLKTGTLAGILENSKDPIWFIVETRNSQFEVQHLLYEIWSGFLGLFERLLSEFEPMALGHSLGAIEIKITFDYLIIPKDYTDKDSSELGAPEIIIDKLRHIATINIPPDFMYNFQQPENIGEKVFLKALAKSLLMLIQEGFDFSDESIQVIVDKILGDSGLRIIHMFRTQSQLEFMLSNKEMNLKLFPQEDFVFSKLRLSEGFIDSQSEYTLQGIDKCNSFLHRMAERIWKQLRDSLRQFDRTSVLAQCLAVHESVLQDRTHWRRTALALIALYSPVEDIFAIAQQRESDRNHIALPSRILMEMGICECPNSGGRPLSPWEHDELLAKTALLIEIGTDSDAIHGGLLQPSITVYPNGEYNLDRNFYQSVINPFLESYIREEFEGAASDYSNLYIRERSRGRVTVAERFSSDFSDAFIAEFGISISYATEGIAELLDIALEEDNPIVETKVDLIRERLITNRNYSQSTFEAFLKMFSLFPRTDWSVPPDGFKNKDLSPWRFRRKLSASFKPILTFGLAENDKIMYGAGTLIQSFSHLIERTEKGQLPSDFFFSGKMKRFMGQVNHKLGNQFSEYVAREISKNGWKTRSNISMTELGASSRLGDIDVLAWNEEKREVFIIECKRLQLARTIAEIAEICKRFRGDAKDELDRHLKRINNIKDNPDCLKSIVGFTPNSVDIKSKLVTNTHVPMMYLNTLPISSKDIVLLNNFISEL